MSSQVSYVGYSMFSLHGSDTPGMQHSSLSGIPPSHSVYSFTVASLELRARAKETFLSLDNGSQFTMPGPTDQHKTHPALRNHHTASQARAG